MLLGRPLVEAMIVEDPDGRRYYNAIEPKLDTRVRQDSLTELLSLVSKDALLLEKVNAAATVEKAYELLLPIARTIVRSKVKGGVFRKTPSDLEAKVNEAASAVAYHAAKELVGYGAIDPLIRDPYIEDVSCNGIGIPVFIYHTRYEWLTTNIVISDLEYLKSLVSKLGVKGARSHRSRPRSLRAC
ncbi:MAG: hypothetical protein MGAcid_02570 [uncultured Acidilobus sp. MG]|jgi:Type IV secretory pathway, VirB11 components, and related ATPases involved in archaeal flagella biosynthesis|nr:MAG: hypothetical protein MGAcid_02570 [uncultured Acidilobus sp. MG]